MNSKSTTIRVFGQRSIASSFGSLPSSSSADSKQVVGKEVSKKGTPVSLSDFLDRKLQKTAVPPRKVLQGKSTPFSSPLGSSVSAGGHVLAKRKDEGEATSVSKVIFEQFKHADAGKREFILPCNAGEVESCTNNYLESRKRRNHFEATGGNDNHNVGNHVVVLGGDSKPNQKRRNDSFIKFKKPRHLYNHYANGCGWWDCDMEGVDNEEVGFSEVWEGVGSTSLGGIEWH
ncbi:Non-specific serine/threonine protein kinase [Quillaja saponaria]|uniref:Non-specific serine/threonine protein kinase n=1 Tax=Quillaja saponaria TaxID=32244 RepID=A0AAD7LCH2_QUISA|nr:Non-specific serine/threonine protein kinase [Quillaja saponaria]